MAQRPCPAGVRAPPPAPAARRAPRVAVAFGLAAALLGGPDPALAQEGVARRSIFGTNEVAAANLTPFRKWTRMLDRQSTEQALYDEPCRAGVFSRCRLPDWRALLAELAGRDRMAQIEGVNRFFNQFRYIVDPTNYEVADYWATPLQFIARDGDCEDYAIAKYVSLRTLGLPTGQMRVVVLNDLNLRIAHAVLVVYLDGQALVLDNQISRVVPESTIRHYQPVFSLNESGWWLHRR